MKLTDDFTDFDNSIFIVTNTFEDVPISIVDSAQHVQKKINKLLRIMEIGKDVTIYNKLYKEFVTIFEPKYYEITIVDTVNFASNISGYRKRIYFRKLWKLKYKKSYMQKYNIINHLSKM